MPNLLYQYGNGTFEPILTSWNGEFYPFNYAEIIRDGTEFYEGSYSARIKTNIGIPSFKSFKPILKFVFAPAVTGDAYEATLRIKCSAQIPDETIFYLIPNYSIGRTGLMAPVTGAQAKTGWIELKVNFIAEAFHQGADIQSFFTLVMVYGSDLFDQAYPSLKDDFPDSIQYYANVNMPSGAFFYVDAAYVEAKAMPIPPAPLERDLLYHVENVFMLRVGSTIFSIEEPIKWDSLMIGIEFDESARAYKFEFTDKDVLLEFDDKAGRQKLIEEYIKNGVDGNASLKFGEKDFNGVITILYEGDLNFESYREGKYTIRMNCERRSFGEKMRGYFDTKTDIFTNKSLSGNSVTPISPVDIFMHPRQLTYAAEFKYNYNVSASQVAAYDSTTNYALNAKARVANGKIYQSRVANNLNHEPTTSPGWWQLSTSFAGTLDYEQIPGGGGNSEIQSAIPPFKAVTNNIPGMVDPTPPNGEIIYAGLTLPPGVAKRTFYIEASVAYKVDIGNSATFPFFGFVVFKKSNISSGFDLFVNTANKINTGNVAQTILFPLGGGPAPIISNGSGITIDLFADEAIFVRAYINSPNNNLTNFEWTYVDTHYMKVRELTVYDPTLIKGFRIHEVINKQLETITDRIRPLRSNLLGRIDLGYAANGCASNHLLFNGLMLRDLPDKPFLLSAKDWFNSLNSLFCMGMSIERDTLGGEFVRFEPIEYFFKNILLLKLDTISGYDKVPNDRYIFNELEFGFQKFPTDNQQDSLEDFMTKMNYITPLKKIKNKLSVIIGFILSGYYIEYTRREGFLTNPSNSYETDNDTFMISGTAPSNQIADNVSIVWDSVGVTATINAIIPVIAGDLITVSGGANNNGEFTVLKVENPSDFDKTILELTGSVISGNTISDISIGVARAQAKRDEDFDDVEGVNFSRSVYNLEHHIKRIMLRWAKLFQSGWAMFFKQAEQSQSITQIKTIEFVSGINNTSAGTALKNNITCVYGDSKRITRYDAAKGDLITNYDKPLFGNNIIEFSTQLTWAKLNYIRTAFEGRNPDGKNYGYIQITNPKGEIENGFIMSLKFKPTNNTCKITLMEKYNG